MCAEWQERTAILLGEDALDRLASKKVIVFGLGGVGGYVVEALARVGIGNFTLVDGDTFAESNLNRQILATVDVIGRSKAAVAAERVKRINPSAVVASVEKFLTADNVADFRLREYDYIVDAIDDVDAKVLLAVKAQEYEVPVVSSMGTGNKLSPSFKVEDVYKTSNCPLARIMRKKLKVAGVKKLTVVYSDELPLLHTCGTVGSIAFVPAAAGLTLASKVTQDLIK